MKRIQKFAAINVIVALLGVGIPAMAAQNGYDDHNHGGMQHHSAGHRDTRQWNSNQSRNVRNGDGHYSDQRDYGRGYREGRGADYAYVPAPVYGGPIYENGYYDDRTHNGRTAAIIGGTAAAGALIGAAADRGQGAVIGAVIGGIAGVAVSAAANHHDRH